MDIRDFIVDENDIDGSTSAMLKLAHDGDFVKLAGPLRIRVEVYRHSYDYSSIQMESNTQYAIRYGETRTIECHEDSSVGRDIYVKLDSDPYTVPPYANEITYNSSEISTIPV